MLNDFLLFLLYNCRIIIYISSELQFDIDIKVMKNYWKSYENIRKKEKEKLINIGSVKQTQSSNSYNKIVLILKIQI
jgi:hypothetical protein